MTVSKIELFIIKIEDNMTTILKKGDIISLQNIKNYKVTFVVNCNLFRIKSINVNTLELYGVDGDVLMSDIHPVHINGVDDVDIYYDPIILPDCIECGDPVPLRKKNRSYYVEVFKCETFETLKNKSFYDVIQEQNLSYVHEVQQFLKDRFNEDSLKINRIFFS